MNITTLNKPLSEVGFVEREGKRGRPVSFKCGRDFLYYALNFYFPDTFNVRKNNPLEIDRKGLFGLPMPKYLAWTQLQFSRAPKLLREHGLRLYINNRHIGSYWDFVAANLFSRVPYANAIERIERCVRSNTVCAVDMPVGKGLLTLLDHVMFVYGYDSESLYVIDTLNVSYVSYEPMDADYHYYRLSKKEIARHWSKFGRIWEVRKQES